MLKNSHVRQYQGIIQQAIWRIKRAYPWADFGELSSHAYQIYMEALESYDPAKGLFTTHLTHKLRALARPFDPRSAVAQEYAPLLSLSAQIQSSKNEEMPALGEIIGSEDNEFQVRQILDYFGKAKIPLFLTLARDVLCGELHGVRLNNHNIGKWGMLHGMTRPQSERFLQSFVQIVKEYKEIA